MSAWASWGRLLWLNYTQIRQLLNGLMLFALMVGLVLQPAGPLAWPIVTLFIGVLCGVTVWSDVQLSGSFRFLGDQHLPQGCVWLVKISMRFLMAVAAAAVLLFPSLILAFVHRVERRSLEVRRFFFADVLHSDLIGSIVPVWTHLWLWLLYGFTVGQLWGMFVRKSLVAGVVALGTAGLLVCLWVPSLLGIGLHFWQVAGVPVMLLLASWLLVPAWSADRLLVRSTLLKLGLILTLGGVWTVGGLWYRVGEIPEAPEPFDMSAYVASIPPLDQDKIPAGMTLRIAWKQVYPMSQELLIKRVGDPLFPDLRAGDSHDTFSLEIRAALRYGWPKRSSELGQWLDRKFEEDWYKQLTQIVNQPLGAVERQRTFTDQLTHGWAIVGDLTQLLAVRGLQQQTFGDPQVFVDNLRISLAVSRNLQHRAPWDVILWARQAEPISIAALDRWLEQLEEHPELLERVRDILLEHEAQLPDETEPEKVAYLIARNTLEHVPDQLIYRQLPSTARSAHAERDEWREAEVAATTLCWRIPWEHERHQRILRLAFQDMPLMGQPPSRQLQQAHKWGGSILMSLVPAGKMPRSKRDLALLHAAQVKVGLRLYQVNHHGNLPTTLGHLVPHYLPAIPLDPFDGKPFRYRISHGEDFVWFAEPPLVDRHGGFGRGAPGGLPRNPPAPPHKNVPAGQAILWSVGEDLSDNGGRRQGLHRSDRTPAHTDFIYLVPPPRSPRDPR
jgi:hypothetical protein